MKVLIGVDPHKASVAVAAVNGAGELVECAGFPQNRVGLRALERWSKRFPERRWAVENAGGLGRHLAQRLSAAGESVVDVPPKLSARVRVLSTGNSRKNDGLDALATALAAWRNERLAAVDPEAGSEVLRLLSERRGDLVAERTRALNRLHGLLRDLVPGGVAGTLSTHRAARILRGIRPQGASARLRRRLASEILRDIRALERKISDLNERIEAEVTIPRKARSLGELRRNPSGRSSETLLGPYGNGSRWLRRSLRGLRPFGGLYRRPMPVPNGGKGQ